jgi:hypothetical protein
VVSVGGERPWLALGCVASFPPKTGEMRVDAFDPEEDEIDSVALDGVTRDRFVSTYYEPFIAAVRAGGSDRSDDHIVSATFDAIRLRVGISREIARKVVQAPRGSYVGLYESVRATLDEERNLPGFSDGTFIETDWEDSIGGDDWQN